MAVGDIILLYCHAKLYKRIGKINMIKKIYASYDEQIIRVYQAFSNEIADEALKLGHLGNKFRLNRMTWIKPSFLWMMYRSGWATKEKQERVLAFDIKIEGFREMLQSVVLSNYDETIYGNCENWKKMKEKSEVICQWDPDRNISLEPLDRRAIQLGIRGEMVYKYVNTWTVKITDITNTAYKIKYLYDIKRTDEIELPIEKEFSLSEKEKFILGIKER